MDSYSEYSRIRKNLIRRHNALLKRGYHAVNLPTDEYGKLIIPVVREMKIADKDPDLSELKRISENIYRYYVYTNPFTGETVSGVEGRAIERSAAVRKAAATRQTIDYAAKFIEIVLSLPSFYYGRGRRKYTHEVEQQQIIDLINSNAYSSLTGEINKSYQKWIRNNWKTIQDEANILLIAQSENNAVGSSYTKLINIAYGQIAMAAQQSTLNYAEDSVEEYY